MKNRLFLAAPDNGIRWCCLTVIICSAMLESAGLGQESGIAVDSPEALHAERDRLQAETNRLYGEGKFTEATASAEATLAIERRWLGAGANDIASTLVSLAKYHEMLGDWDGAEKWRQEYLAWARKYHANDAWRVGNGERLLAWSHQLRALSKADWERWRDAEMEANDADMKEDKEPMTTEIIASYKHAMDVDRELFGAESETYATRLVGLAGKLADASQFAEAVKTTRESIAIRKKLLGGVHPDVAYAVNRLGTILQAMGDFAAARACYEEVLAIDVELFGEGDEETGTPLNNLGTSTAHLGDYAGAKAYLEQALAVYRKHQGDEGSDTIHEIANLAALMKIMGDYKAARRYYEQAVTLTLRVNGENHVYSAAVLQSMGGLLMDIGDYRGAKPYMERALAIRRKLYGNDHPETAGSLNDLGLLAKEMDDLGTAKAYLEESLAIKMRSLGEMHEDTSITMNNLASLFRELGDHARERTLRERVLEIDEKLFGVGNFRTATALNNIGLMLKELGEYEAARGYYERTLAALLSGGREETDQYSGSLGNMASLCAELGDYPSARRYFEQALAIDRKLYDDESPNIAGALSDLGYLAGRMGDHSASLSYDMRALAIYRKAYGEDHSKVARALVGVGNSLAALGKYAEARPYLERALAIYRNAFGESNPDTINAEQSLATILNGLNDSAAALPMYLHALETTRRVYGDQHPETANAFATLALRLAPLGDYAKAKSYLEYALAVERKYFGNQHPKVAENLMHLGVVMWWLNDMAKSEELLRESVEIGAKLVADNALAGDEEGQLALVREQRESLDYYLSVLLRRAGSAEAAYREVLRWKGGLMVRERAQRLAADDEALKPAFEELRAVVRQWATLAHTPGKDTAKWQKQLDELKTRKEQLAVELGQRSAAYAQSIKAVSLAELEAALPADAALVDFLEFRYGEPHPTVKGTVLWSSKYVAFVLRKGRPLQMFKLADAERVADAIDTWRKTYGVSREAQKAGADLREAIWKPLLGAIGDAKLVLVSPDGALGKLPFAALPGSAPGKYLIDDVAVVMIPVPQLLPALVSNVQAKALSRELLVLGGVDYDNRGAVATGAAPAADHVPRAWELRDPERLKQQVVVEQSIAKKGQWPFLGGTDSELSFIRDLYTNETGLPRDTDRVVALRGREATEEAFRRLAPQAYVLHLATHGFFAGADKQSALAMGTRGSSGTLGGDGAAAAAGTGFDPGLLSGLVLAGANNPPAIPDDPEALATIPDDGYLTADEIALMPLAGAQLVVLSACESGLGQTAGGEGMLGIQRAFQVAGARTTIATLWTIPDQATQQIMGEFYRKYLKERVSPLEALIAAQRWALDHPEEISRGADPPGEASGNQTGGRLPPKYWAAFTLSGDWR